MFWIRESRKTYIRRKKERRKRKQAKKERVRPVLKDEHQILVLELRIVKAQKTDTPLHVHTRYWLLPPHSWVSWLDSSPQKGDERLWGLFAQCMPLRYPDALNICFVPLSIGPVSFRSMHHVYQYETEIQIKGWWQVSEATDSQGHLAARSKCFALAYPLLENDIAFRILLWVHVDAQNDIRVFTPGLLKLGEKWKHLEEGTVKAVKVCLWQSFPHRLKTMTMLRTVHSEHKFVKSKKWPDESSG